jgi:hypothetical protein
MINALQNKTYMGKENGMSYRKILTFILFHDGGTWGSKNVMHIQSFL